MVEVVINNEQDGIIDGELMDKLTAIVQKTLSIEGFAAEGEVSLTLTDNAELQLLNKKYRGVDAPTDVLSFPMLEEGEEKNSYVLLGDVVISVEKAIEQAKEYGHSLQRELAYLTVHGILHLLGYDHLEEKDKSKMRSREEEILSLLEIYR
jgi:probable rRNA maturation factor